MTKQEKIYKLCLKFIKENKIGCSETIFQTDMVSE
jgi:hypothetical protein